MKKNISELFVSDTKYLFISPNCHFHSAIIKNDGSIVQILLTSLHIQLSGHDYVCLIIGQSAETNEHYTENVLKYNHFNLLFSKNPFPGIIFNRESGRIILVNEAASELYGYSLDEFCSIKLEDISLEGKIPVFPLNIEQVIPDRYFKTVACHQTKSKDVIEVEMHTRPYNLNNQPAAISYIKNITNRTSVNSVTETGGFYSGSKLQSKGIVNSSHCSDSLSSLESIILSNMSHELRTPLVGILGYSDILKNEVANYELKQMADVIHKSGEKLLTDLNMVLNLSAIEIGLTKLFYVEADLCEIILKVIAKVKCEAEKKHLYLNFKIAQKEFLVMTDKELIFDTLYYIIDNAIKFTNSGGVTVELDFAFEEGSPYYTIKVTDTGLGISEEQQQIIYNAFRQISEGSNRKYGGLGIGLTVAKKIVMMFGGKIAFSSKLNEGTQFQLSFPVA
jgi:PAS domain S-box-containing protein